MSRARPVVAVVAGFAAGAVPFSNLMAHRRAGVDLRSVGAGTVSGTALAEVAGLGPLVVAGLFEVAKGALGPVLAGRGHPTAAALAGAAAVAGHNWSPWLRGAGGRGISPAMGALLVSAPVGSLVLLSGLAIGRLAGETALGCLAAYVVLVPFVSRTHGRPGARAAAAVLMPMLVKRIMGNAPPVLPGFPVYAYRLLLDRDTWEKPGVLAGRSGPGPGAEGAGLEGAVG